MSQSTYLTQQNTCDNHILKYYCAIRLNPLLDIPELPSNVSFVNPEYYNDSIAIIRNLKHIRNFPNIRSKGIYETLLPKCQPIIESKINLNWKITWKHLNFRFVNIYERELMFKFLHGILTTRLRLFNIKQASSPQCKRCSMVEDNLHMFNECVKVKHIVIYFKNLVETLYEVKNLDMKDVLYLRKLSNNKLECNTLVVLTSAFIGTIWYNRDTINDIDIVNFKMKLLSHFKLLSLIPKMNINLYFTEKYCRLPEILFPQ